MSPYELMANVIGYKHRGHEVYPLWASRERLFVHETRCWIKTKVRFPEESSHREQIWRLWNTNGKLKLMHWIYEA